MTVVSKIIRPVGAFGLAAAVSVAIVAYGQGLWQPLVIANMRVHPEVPWAAPTMAVLLAGLLAYLSGRGWPRSTSATRRKLFRWNRMPISTFFLAIGAGSSASRLSAACGSPSPISSTSRPACSRRSPVSRCRR